MVRALSTVSVFGLLSHPLALLLAWSLGWGILSDLFGGDKGPARVEAEAVRQSLEQVAALGEHEATADLYAALLGGKVEVKAPDGTLRVSLPAGTQPGAKIRLKGRGMPKYKAEGRGDLYAVIQVALPQNLSEEEREHLTKAAASRQTASV